MASFAKATFDTAAYLACRPSYPARVYEIIHQFHSHGGGYGHALDLGCGPGFVALEMAKRFKAVTGLDPASKMVEVGLQPSSSSETPRINYKVGAAEDMASAGVADESVDLVTAGQAAHWFDHGRTWKELHRVLKPGGTVAYIAYAELRFPTHPHLDRLITHHSSSKDALGPYWAQPGRSIVEGLLHRVPFPVQPSSPRLPSIPDFPMPEIIDEPPATGSTGWDPSTAFRIETARRDGARPWLMRKTLSWTDFEGYLRTWSSLHSYHEAHAEDKALGEKGDIVGRLVKVLRDQLDHREEIEVGWPLAIMMIKKEA